MSVKILSPRAPLELPTGLPPVPASLPVKNPTQSFWATDPSKVLLGHRTTQEVPQTADVVIIGSGMAGGFAAHSIYAGGAGETLNVTMYEAREISSGASGRNGGHCQPLIYTKPPNIAAFELKNYNFIRELIEENKIECEFQARPAVHAYYSEVEFEQARIGIRKLREKNPAMAKHCKIVLPDSVSPSLEDLRIPDAIAAVSLECAASLWPYKLIAWMLENILAGNPTGGSDVNRGTFNLQTNTPITNVYPISDGMWGVASDRGLTITRHVIFATNGYTSSIWPTFADLIEPVRGEMSAMEPPTPMDSEIHQSYAFFGATGKSGDGDYLIQRPNGGSLMFGGARYLAPNSGIGLWDDSKIDKAAAHHLRRSLPRLMELDVASNKKLRVTHEWTGIMGYSRDNKPWIGAMPNCPGVWMCAGFSGHGMPQAALCARAVVDMVISKGFAGEDLESVQQRLVESGDLPEDFIMTAERVIEARNLPKLVDQLEGETQVEEQAIPGTETKEEMSKVTD